MRKRKVEKANYAVKIDIYKLALEILQLYEALEYTKYSI